MHSWNNVIEINCTLCDVIWFLFLGDSTVGKTALIQSFYSDGTQYPKSYLMVS